MPSKYTWTTPDGLTRYGGPRTGEVTSGEKAVDKEIGKVVPNNGTPVYQDEDTEALIGSGGNIIGYPASAGDVLRQAASVAPVATAISTTAAVAIAIPAQSTKVRVAWQGRGSAGAASGTARLNIACNRENLTAGLVASQDARRRDYQLAAGEAVVLTSATPITVVYCSANESVSVNTHSIQISYE